MSADLDSITDLVAAMYHSQIMKILSLLPKRLVERAYIAESGSSAAIDPAWNRADAIEVITNLTKGRISVIGCEVWVATRPNPTIPSPFFYCFEADPSAVPKIIDQVAALNNQYSQYISNFQWDTHDFAFKTEIPYFNLTVDGEW